MPPFSVASSHTKGLVITIFGVVLLSPDGLFLRLIAVDGWTLLWWRGVFVALGVSIILTKQGELSDAFSRPSLARVAAAALFAVSTICFVHSIRNTHVANTLVILSASPLVAALLSKAFLNDTIKRETWIAVAVVLAGILAILLESLTTGRLFGDVLALGTAITMAGALVAVRTDRGGNPLPALAYGSVAAALVSWPWASALDIGLRDLVLLAVLGLMILPLAFGLIFLGPKYLTAPEVSLILLLETVLGPLWVWLVVNERPSSQVITAGAFILITIAAHAILGIYRNSNLHDRKGIG